MKYQKFLALFIIIFYSLCFKNGLTLGRWLFKSIIEVMGRQGDLRGLQCAVKSEKVQLKLFFLNLDFSALMQFNQYFVLKKIFLGYCWLLFPSKYSMIKKANSWIFCNFFVGLEHCALHDDKRLMYLFCWSLLFPPPPA